LCRFFQFVAGAEQVQLDVQFERGSQNIRKKKGKKE
jgi:hypothetical protein